MADVTAAGSGGAGLGTPAARWALIAVWVLGVLSGAIQGDFGGASAALAVLAHLAALPGAILLTTPGNRTLGRGRALAVVGFAVLTALLVFWNDPMLQQAWLFNFSVYLVALLIARGNTVAGSAGGAILISLGITWAWIDSWAIGAIAELVAVPAVALLVGWVWRLVLCRIVASERRHRSEEDRAALTEELALRSAAADREELTEVLGQAGPLLDELTRGRELDTPFRAEVALAEASIRDRIRSPWAAHPALVEAIAARRGAGVDVLLLGESEAPLGEALAEAVAGVVAGVERGSVTVHAVPPGRGHAVSVLQQDESRTVRVMFSEDGSVIGRH